MATISATLIVKNAQDSIESCLLSFVDDVDEVIVVDTGSTDDTVEVLEHLQSTRPHLRIEHFEWIKDFAAARNYALAFATKEWVFWVDADDVVENAATLRALADAQPPEICGLYLPYEYRPGVIFDRERLVRNDGSYEWRYPIHEVLWIDFDKHGTRTLRSDDVRVVHHRGEDSNESNNSRNLGIHHAYHERLARAGELADARSYFYFANDLRGGDQYEEAILRYWQAIARSTWHDERYQAHHFIGDCLRKTGRPLAAIEVNLLAIEVDASWPDAYLGIAESYYDLMEWREVIEWTRRGLELPEPTTLAVTNSHDYRYWPFVYLAWAHFQLEDLPAAQDAAERALEQFESGDMRALVTHIKACGGRASSPADDPPSDGTRPTATSTGGGAKVRLSVGWHASPDNRTYPG